VLDRELGKCVGVYEVYAYLRVTGETEQWEVTNGRFRRVRVNVDGRILPQRVSVPFKIERDLIPPRVDRVRTCDQPLGANAGTQPTEILERVGPVLTPKSYTRPDVPTADVEDTESCIEGTASFAWVSGTVTVAIAAASKLKVDAPLIGRRRINVQTTGAVGLRGDPYALEVTFVICYQDGQIVTADDDRVNRVGDAEAVFTSGGTLTLQPVP
jgi:hypothetical protein